MDADRIESVVHRFYRDVAAVTPGDVLIVGVSGGPDSMALLQLTYDLREAIGLEPHVAHFDHGLRPDSADDADFVIETAVGLELPVTVESGDVRALGRERGKGTEEAARAARHDFLERVRTGVGGRYTVLGHNLEDQAETILMRLFRGAGTVGALGMRPVSGSLIRPLLGVSRNTILEYCGRRGINYRIDPSNQTPNADRNRLRLQIMPEIRRIWSGVDSVLARDADLLREDAEVLAWAARAAVEAIRMPGRGGRIELRRGALRQLPAPVARLVLKTVMSETGCPLSPPKSLLDGALRFCTARQAGGRMDFGAGVEILRGHDSVLIQSTSTKPGRISDCSVLRVPGSTCIRGISLTIESTLIVDPAGVGEAADSVRNANPTVAVLDYDAIEKPIIIRRRHRGDRFVPFGHTSETTLSRLLMDRHISWWKRDAIPVVAGRNGIVWIGGIEIDDRYQVTGSTESVLRLRLVDENSGP